MQGTQGASPLDVRSFLINGYKEEGTKGDSPIPQIEVVFKQLLFTQAGGLAV